MRRGVVCPRRRGQTTFQSTHPLRGATKGGRAQGPPPSFQSTHPLRGATRVRCLVGSLGLDFNPRTPCGVRRGGGVRIQVRQVISIHAPLAGCDRSDGRRAAPAGISIHAPLAGCDVKVEESTRWADLFQSTHPLRGATRVRRHRYGRNQISIHAPLAGCDARRSPRSSSLTRFQSTHPLRGATTHLRPEILPFRISIHAPLAGCDTTVCSLCGPHTHFNPRTPCGVRPACRSFSGRLSNFNPRTPCGVRRMTARATIDRLMDFNPRTPCGVRLLSGSSSPWSTVFQSTHPLRGATTEVDRQHRHREFQSTHPLRGATRDYVDRVDAYQISIHAPLAGCDK